MATDTTRSLLLQALKVGLRAVVLWVVITLVFIASMTRGPGVLSAGGTVSASSAADELLEAGSISVSIIQTSIVASCHPYMMTAHLDGSATGGSPPYTFAWSFGDGSPVASGQNITHSYSSLGPYTVTLWVTDVLGDNGSARDVITGAAPPCAALRLTSSPNPLPLVIAFGAFGAIAATITILAYLGTRKPGRPIDISG